MIHTLSCNCKTRKAQQALCWCGNALESAGGLTRCLVITKSYRDIKTRWRYSVRCRRHSLHNTDTSWNCLPGHSPHTGLRTNVLPWHSPREQLLNSSLPYTDFKPLFAIPNFAPFPQESSPSAYFPHLHFGGMGLWSHPSSLLLTSKPRQDNLSTTALLCPCQCPCTRGWAHPLPRGRDSTMALTTTQNPHSLCIATSRCRSEFPCRATFSQQKPPTPTAASCVPHPCPLALGICSEGRHTLRPVVMPLWAEKGVQQHRIPSTVCLPPVQGQRAEKRTAGRKGTGALVGQYHTTSPRQCRTQSRMSCSQQGALATSRAVHQGKRLCRWTALFRTSTLSKCCWSNLYRKLRKNKALIQISNKINVADNYLSTIVNNTKN